VRAAAPIFLLSGRSVGEQTVERRRRLLDLLRVDYQAGLRGFDRLGHRNGPKETMSAVGQRAPFVTNRSLVIANGGGRVRGFEVECVGRL
jgi:hypothetical protein